MAEEINAAAAQNEDVSEILKIRRDKLKELQSAGRDPFRQVRYDRDTYSSDITDNFAEMEGKDVSLAGRIMSKRDMGKASFCDIYDRYGKMQLYIRSDDIGEDSYREFKKLDIGDIIGVSGKAFLTKRGEKSVHVDSYALLSKSLLPLPEKWHGLKDTDLRYRQRYVDLIVNPSVRRPLKSAARSLRAFEKSWMKRALWRWKRRFSTPFPAAPRPGPSLPIIIPWISTCTFASRRSCI
jgi:lysyl-tRNA synthetase class 2